MRGMMGGKGRREAGCSSSCLKWEITSAVAESEARAKEGWAGATAAPKRERERKEVKGHISGHMLHHEQLVIIYFFVLDIDYDFISSSSNFATSRNQTIQILLQVGTNQLLAEKFGELLANVTTCKKKIYSVSCIRCIHTNMAFSVGERG